MKAIFFLFFILFMSVSALAIDCNTLSNKAICNEISNSNISNKEKDYLISGVIAETANFPSYDFVRQWNLKINTSNPTENVTKYNQGYIKNAWVDLLAVMPSVLENNTLYCTNKGEVLSAFNHDVVIPNNLIGSDCRTNYNLVENKGVLNVYANNNYQGSGKLVNFTTNQDTEFKSEYDISVKTDIQHYQWKQYCCQRNRRGQCTRWCQSCDYVYTEHKVDELKLTDTLNAKYYNPKTTANFSVIDKYSDTTKGILSGSNFTSLHLYFSNSYIEEFDYFYSIIWNANNVLTVKADKNKVVENNNLFFEGNETYKIIVKDVTNCKLEVYNHFENKTIPCNLNFEELNISINTNKLSYKPNETINIIITPSNRLFNLTYANQTFTAKNSLNLTAVYPYNKLAIIYNGRSYEKIIHVENEGSIILLFSLSIFGGINYTFIGLLKKYWGVVNL